MIPALFAAVLPILGKVLDRVIPDPVAREQARAELLSAQAQADLAELKAECGIDIPHYPDVTEAPADLDKMAALVGACDLVITASQTALHVAGAMGVPCWLMVPNKPDWRLGLNRDHMAWYGKHLKMYRQGKDETDWAPCIERVGTDLRRLIEERDAEDGRRQSA